MISIAGGSAPRRQLPLFAAWLAILLAATGPALRIGAVVRGGSDAVRGAESMEAIDAAVAAGVPAGTFYPFVAVLHSQSAVVADAQFAAAGRQVTAALLNDGGASAVQSLWSTGDMRLAGRSGHSALLLIRTSAATFSQAELVTASLRSAVAASRLPAGFSCEITGQPAVLYDLNRRSSADLLSAERIGLPLTLLILLLVFRSPVAALLPIALALSATTISMAALYLLSRFTVVSVFAENTITMIGLGVGVDYALLLVGAFRRALGSGLTPPHAAQRAVRQVRSTIVCSGAAVAVGFLALLLVRLPFLKALVFGGVVVVVAAVLVTLTLLPALLGVLGAWLNWPFPSTRAERPSVFWMRWAHLVMRRPVLAAGLALALLAFLVSPVMRMSGWNLGASGLAGDLEARAGYEILKRDFAAGWIGPTAIVLEALPGHTVLEDGVRAHASRLAQHLAHDPRIAAIRGFPDLDAAMRKRDLRARQPRELPEPLRSAAIEACGAEGRVAILALMGVDAPESPAAAALVAQLRAAARDEFGNGFTLRVTGAAAMLTDFDREIFSKMWVVVPAVLLVTFVVLLIHLRSLLIPLKAIALNLLSVLASYGFLICIFQDGHGAGLLRLTPPGGLNAFIVLMLFTILFGLSMDYEVFLLSAMRARHVRRGEAADAVAHGIATTGGTITSAAAIMITLFLSFGFTELIATREFGLGLAFAVALDATLVRLVLLPALMALFGRANWWLPALGSRPQGKARMTAQAHAAPRASGAVGPWQQIDELARLAPTPHNTQPFRIRPLTARLAQILILRERMLPVEDTGNLYVLCSFGIFAETLERAGRHFGVELTVTPEPGIQPAVIEPGAGPLVLGRVEVTGRCEREEQRTLLEARRTSRLPYDNRLVDAQALAEFAGIAAQAGHRFECFADPLIVRNVLRRNVRALLENNLKSGELEELRNWIRIADTPDIGDGLWAGPMNQPRWEMRLALKHPRLFLLPGIAALASAKYLRSQAGTRHVAILRGPFGSWAQLVAAGRMLMRLWLSMTCHNVYMLPFGSMITNSCCHRYLCERFGADDIWFILRLGYSALPPRAPRLASVLWRAGTDA